MQHHAVDHDRGLAAVVDDPVVADDLGHPAPVEIHVEVELGRAARRANRDAGLRADGSRRPDMDPAAAREKHARRLSRAAVHPTVHRDGLLAVAVGSHCGYALRYIHVVDDAHEDAVRARRHGFDRAPDGDRHAPGLLGPEMVGDDAVGVVAGRGDGVAVPGRDVDVAVARMTTIDTVRIRPARRDRAASRSNCHVSHTGMHAINAL